MADGCGNAREAGFTLSYRRTISVSSIQALDEGVRFLLRPVIAYLGLGMGL
jgi:hypothetical protein